MGGCCYSKPLDAAGDAVELAQPSEGPQAQPPAADTSVHKAVRFAPEAVKSSGEEGVPVAAGVAAGVAAHPDQRQGEEAAAAAAAAATATATATATASADAADLLVGDGARQWSQGRIASFMQRVGDRISSITRLSFSQEGGQGGQQQQQECGPVHLHGAAISGPGFDDDSEEGDDESEEEDEEELSVDEDIVGDDADVGTHSGRVLAPITKTTKLQVGVLEGTTFLNQYVVVDTLGRGSFGNVKLCLNTLNDTLYAVKAVNKKLLRRHAQSGRTFGHDPLQDLKREVEVMRALNHPNLIKLKEVIEDKKGGKVLMVMEYASGGALVGQNQLTREHHMPEAMAQYYFKQIVAGLACLHANRVVHGDLKPENVLLSGDCTLKIADFGQSQFFEKKGDTFSRTLGTPAFLPPEVCCGEAYRGRDADMWALGVSLFLFVYGELPFQAESVAGLYDAIAQGEVVYPDYVTVSTDLMDLLESLLQKDPSKRATSAEVLHHPWVTGTGWKAFLPDVVRLEGGEEPGGAAANKSPSCTIATAEEVAAVVFPEMMRTDASGLTWAQSSEMGLVEALMSSNKAARRALRVRDASRLRTLAASSGGSLARGPDSSNTLRTAKSYAGSSFSLDPAPGRPPSFGGSGSRGQQQHLLSGSSTWRSSESNIMGSDREGTAAAAAEPAAAPSTAPSAAPADAPMPRPFRQFSLEGPFACSTAGPSPSPPAAPAPAAAAADLGSKPTPGPSGFSEEGTPALASVQSAPVGSVAAFQRVLKTAKSLHRMRQQAEGSIPEEEEEEGEGEGGAGSSTTGLEGLAREEGLDLSESELKTAEAFVDIVLVMQQAAAAQQAHQGQDEAGDVAEPALAQPDDSRPPLPAQLPQQEGGQRARQVSLPPSLSRITECETEQEPLEPAFRVGTEPGATAGPAVPPLTEGGSAGPVVGCAEISGSAEATGEVTGAAVGATGQSGAARATEGPSAEEDELGEEDLLGSMPLLAADISFTSPFASPPLSPASSMQRGGPAAQPLVIPKVAAATSLRGLPTSPFGSQGPTSPTWAQMEIKSPVSGATSLKDLPLSPFGSPPPPHSGWGPPPPKPAGATSLKDLPHSPFDFDAPSPGDPQAAPDARLTGTGASTPAAFAATQPNQAAQQAGPGAAAVQQQPGEPSATAAAGAASEEPPLLGTGGLRDGQGNFIRGALGGPDSHPTAAASAAQLRGVPTRPPEFDRFDTMLYNRPLRASDLPPDFPPIQTVSFLAGEVVASYVGGQTALLAYIESGYVEVNYQADLPVPLSTMAALATGLVGHDADVGMLLEMDDKVDSVAYGSNLVDIASILASGSMGLSSSSSELSSRSDEPTLERAQTLMLTVKKATERAEQLLRNATAGGGIDELLVSERGPQQFLGALSALDPDFMGGRWKMRVVARTDVQALVMTKEGLGAFLQNNPLAQVHLRAGLARARGEIIRLEALEKLASAREHRDARRRQAAAAAAAAAAAKGPAASAGNGRPAAGPAQGRRVRVGAAGLALVASEAASSIGEGVGDLLEGVASLDVFGMVSRLRGALAASR